MGLAVSVGSPEKDYSHDGIHHYTLNEILCPFETTLDYVQADYQPLFALYGTIPTPENQLTPEQIDKSAQDYLIHLSHFQ